MDRMKNKITKADSQAWRKGPRKFAPKSRLGCKTCKIRRIKCDLARPSCLKCISTGRACDGYNETPVAFKTEKTEFESARYHKEIADRADSCYRYHPVYESNVLILQNLGSFMILPETGSMQAEAMCFFQDISIKHLNEYRPCEPWRNTLMFFSQTVPSVRHAAIALALMHRNYLDRHSNGQVYQPPSLKDQLPDKAPLLHYNRAIQLLLNLESGDSVEVTAVTLLVCYLFTCFDHLVGDDVQAVKHLRGGVALSRTLNNSAYDEGQPSGIHTVICQATEQIRRLDMQAAVFLVDWSPANINIQETFMSQLALSHSSFWSLDQAADHLQILVSQVMRLHHTEQKVSPTDTLPPFPSSSLKDKDIVLGQLETWSRLFETLLQQGNSPSDPDLETNPLQPLLRLQHTITRTLLLNTYSPDGEKSYDNFLPQFQQCITLAHEVAATHQRYSGPSKSTFTPEIGFLPILYILGVKCRHPHLRREVLRILRRQLIREASWDSISTARVVERVIEIEEGGDGLLCMDQIPVWRRIETLSFLHVPKRGGDAARLDVEYTFCGREGVHVESIMMEQIGSDCYVT